MYHAERLTVTATAAVLLPSADGWWCWQVDGRDQLCGLATWLFILLAFLLYAIGVILLAGWRRQHPAVAYTVTRLPKPEDYLLPDLVYTIAHGTYV